MIGSTISTWALLIAETLEQSGVDSRAIFERIGLDYGLLELPDERYSLEGMTELWEAAAEATGDPCFGFEVVHHVRPTSLHALGFAWLASSTLRDAFDRLVKYSHLISDRSVVETRREEGATYVSIRAKEGTPPYAECSADASLGVMIRMCRMSCGDAFAPIRADIAHERHACFSRHRDWFACAVAFGTPEHGVLIGDAVLDEHLPASNATLAYANEQVIRDYLDARETSGFEKAVEREIVRQLSGGTSSVDSVSLELGVSSRTLQRRLRHAGTSFREIFQRTRLNLAVEYVGSSSRPVGEISFLLGYSEVSNFTRAFRRATGVPPAQYRQRISTGAHAER
jgi:AraC-like DNA-binding protein